MFDMKFSGNQIVYQKAKSIIQKTLCHAVTNFTICLCSRLSLLVVCEKWSLVGKFLTFGPCVHDRYFEIVYHFSHTMQ